MSVVFGTLGYRPQSLIPTIRATGDVEQVIFYYGGDKRAAEAKDRVLDYCKKMKIPAKDVELPNVFDLLGIAKIIKADLRKCKADGKKIAIFNIAGGTRLTSSGALLACMIEGVPTVYVRDDTYEEFTLPLLEIKYEEILSDKEKEILGIVLENQQKGKQLTGVELAKLLKVKKATVNYHVHRLIEKGAVELTPHGDDSRKKLIKAQPAIELLFGD